MNLQQLHEDTIKAVRSLEEKGEKELAKRLLVSFIKFHNNFCPICNKLVTDELDIQFLADSGRCINCDHVEYGLQETQ